MAKDTLHGITRKNNNLGQIYLPHECQKKTKSIIGILCIDKEKNHWNMNKGHEPGMFKRRTRDG